MKGEMVEHKKKKGFCFWLHCGRAFILNLSYSYNHRSSLSLPAVFVVYTYTVVFWYDISFLHLNFGIIVLHISSANDLMFQV